jgi:hypothetical protein
MSGKYPKDNMDNIKLDVSSVLFSNAKNLGNNSIWVGVGEENPGLVLSKELTPSFGLFGEVVGGFFYSLYLLFNAPVK